MQNWGVRDMKLNFNTKLCSKTNKSIFLIPYRKEFVLKYHEWMQDPNLLEMTASEALSLEKEYEMQQSWFEDEKKCTFIISIVPSIDMFANSTEVNENDILDLHCTNMIGDVNLFFNDYDYKNKCEIEIMIAKEDQRRKGYGKEAIQMMMQYGIDMLDVEIFYCKIHEDNIASRQLFQKLGYTEVNYVGAFQEYEYQYNVTEIKNSLNNFDEKTHNYINNDIQQTKKSSNNLVDSCRPNSKLEIIPLEITDFISQNLCLYS